MSMRKHWVRHAVSTVVLPGLFAGMVVIAAPATAAMAGGQGGGSDVCTAVLNAYSKRGSVRPELLEAAATSNARVIARLQAKRADLVTQEGVLAAGVTDAQTRLASLNIRAAALDGQIRTVQLELEKLTGDRATLVQAVADREAALATLQANKQGLEDLVASLQTQLAQATTQEERDRLSSELIPFRIALSSISFQVSQRQSELNTVKDQLSAVDAQLASQSTTLEGLLSDRKATRRAIAAQEATVKDLRHEHSAVVKKIAKIDRQLALGGCAA